MCQFYVFDYQVFTLVHGVHAREREHFYCPHFLNPYLAQKTPCALND